jgi:starch phosphorylase
MTISAVAPLPSEPSLKGYRTASGVDALAQSFLDNLFFVQGRSRERATVNDLYMALAHTVRDRLVERWIQTVLNYQAQDVRVVCYLSAEFLTGPHLANNLINLGIYDEAEQAMLKLGLDLDTLIEQEQEPGLGNGVGHTGHPCNRIRHSLRIRHLRSGNP